MPQINRSSRILRNLAPWPLKQGLKYLWGAIPLSIRYGPEFRRTLAFLRSSQWWGRRDLEEYQKSRLVEIIVDAYDRVPFYREAFRRAGIRRELIRGPEILNDIPPIDRQVVAAQGTRMIAEGTRRGMIRITTGGTSGERLELVTRKKHRMAEQAFVFDLWGRVGFTQRSKRAVLRGNVVLSDRYRRTWKIDPLRKELLLSSYHLDEGNLALYVDRIKHYWPDYVHCYPSVIVPLARFIEQRGIVGLPPFKAVLASSENTFPGQRELVERVFRCRYFDLYGQSEQVAMAGECEVSGNYHLYPQYGYTELIDARGRRVTEEGGEGEIVATGFINTAMPLIRYRTGDWAVLGKPECSCGRHYPILESIRGRRDQESVVGRSGAVIPLAMGHNASGIYNRVKQYQFRQERPGELRLTLVRDEGYLDADTEAIRRELVGLLGGEVDLVIRFADEIPRTRNGKFVYFVRSHLSPQSKPATSKRFLESV